MRRYRAALVTILIAVAGLAACDDPTAPPSTPDVEPPVVAITAPSAGITLSGTVIVAATATDNVGVAGVQFLLNGQPLGEEDTEAPYEIAWDTWTTSNGGRSLSARARDAGGNISTTPLHLVVVQNAGTVVVTVLVTAGTAGLGSDADGIEVKVDGGLRGTVPGTGGTVSVSGITRGAHRVQAGGLSFNCVDALPEPVWIDISGEEEIAVELSVRCEPVGSARLAVEVSGEGFDPDGIVVLVDGVARDTLPGTGGEASAELIVGNHELGLAGLYRNCAADAGDVVVVAVEAGQTATADLAVTCERVIQQSAAFTAWSGNDQDIFRTDFGRAGPVNLTASPASDFDPAWSPDGTRIAFVSDRDDSRGEIYLMDPDGSNVTRLTDNEAWEIRPVWSPDGSRIAFASDTVSLPIEYARHYAVYVMDSDGGGRQRLTEAADDASERPAAWSPDGATLLFERAYPGDQAYLYRVSPDGSGPASLADLHGFAVEGADFDPAGLRIAIGYWDDEWYDDSWYYPPAEIVVLNADGSAWTNLTNTEASRERDPVWVSDGAQILFYEEYVGFVLMNADGSDRVTVLPEGGWNLTLSP